MFDLTIFPLPWSCAFHFSKLTDIQLLAGTNIPFSVFHLVQPSIIIAAPQNTWKLEEQRARERIIVQQKNLWIILSESRATCVNYFEPDMK